jgi:serine/threonine-protein kinase ATR
VAVERLFSPFWGVVAIEPVEDLLVRPQSAQLLSDLLRVSVSEFLIMTQSHTLPYLVKTRKIEVINRISDVTGEDNARLLMHKENLVAVLALLLQQNVPDMETYIMSLLKVVSRQFADVEFLSILQNGPCEQALHLLKAAAEADDSKKSRVRIFNSTPVFTMKRLANVKKQIRFGLQYLAEQTVSDINRTKASVLSDFFDYHMLGLVAHLSRTITDVTQTVTEKRRCVKTAEELVKMAKANTRIARPQVSFQDSSSLQRLTVNA